MEKIIKLIEEKQLKKHNRKLEIVFLRNYVCWILRNQNKLKFCEIGKIINRDHSTVINSINTVKKMIDTNDKYFFEKKAIYDLELNS